MKELIRTTDPVLVSWARSVLREAGIESFVFDQNISVVEGSIGAFPQRIMVADDEHADACRTLQDAGYSVETGML